MHEKKGYKAIIFDLDGTLINSLKYHFLAFKDLLLEYGIKIDGSHLRNLIGLPTEQIFKVIKKKYKLKFNLEDLREERRYHYFKFLGRRDIVFPGVKKKLRKLRLRYKLAIATGSSNVILIHSTDKDFQGFFDCIVTINDSVKGKPNPEQLLIAARKLKVDPRECLVIGDSIYDGLAAKRAGMDFFGVTSGYTGKKELLKCGSVGVVKTVSAINI